MKNLSESFPRTGEGIVIDIGTGDGRFVSAMARRAPNKFFIGIDANVKPLEKPSMRATRKPDKGGLANVMFVQAAIEDLPEEFAGVADEIHIHFPWGSLLQSVAKGDEKILTDIRRIAARNCILEIVIGIDPERDQGEIERLGLPELSKHYIENSLSLRYRDAGFELAENRQLSANEWSRFETSWARKLSGNSMRSVVYLVMRAV